MLPAIDSPISSISCNCSNEAAFIASIDLNALAIFLAADSPTYLMPKANSTLSNGTSFDFSTLSFNFIALLTPQPGKRESMFKSIV